MADIQKSPPDAGQKTKLGTRIPVSLHTELKVQAARERVTLDTVITRYLEEGLKRARELAAA